MLKKIKTNTNFQKKESLVFELGKQKLAIFSAPWIIFLSGMKKSIVKTVIEFGNWNSNLEDYLYPRAPKYTEGL